MSANSIHQKLGANAVVIEYPIGLESNLRGVIDLVKMVAYNYSTNNPTEEPTVTEIPEEYKDKANEYHHKMLEALANYNDDLMMLVLEGEEPEIDLVKSTIRKATINGDIFPVLCGSAYKNKGVRLLLDAVIDYLPPPLDIPAAVGKGPDGNEVVCKPDDNEPLAALAFKIMTDPFIGRLCFFRVYSGVAKAGTYVYNASKGPLKKDSQDLF